MQKPSWLVLLIFEFLILNLSCCAAEPDSDITHFNKGVASYKKGDYQNAVDAFTQALITDEKQVEADALYNLGNCQYQLGKAKEGADVSGAAALLRESLDYYKRAVEVDQKNTDARYNHEFVERALKVLLDKQKQKTEDGGQKTEDQEKEKSEDPETGKPKDEKTEKQENGKTEETQEKEGASSEEAGQQKEEQEAAEEKNEGLLQENESRELSHEEARLLLERYGRDEAAPDNVDRRVRRAYDNQVFKDW